MRENNHRGEVGFPVREGSHRGEVGFPVRENNHRGEVGFTVRGLCIPSNGRFPGGSVCFPLLSFV